MGFGVSRMGSFAGWSRRGAAVRGRARDSAASAACGAGLGTERATSSCGLSVASATCALRESIRPSVPIPCAFAAPPHVLARRAPPRRLSERCEADFRRLDFRLSDKRRNGNRRRFVSGRATDGRFGLPGSRVHARVARLACAPVSLHGPRYAFSRKSCREEVLRTSSRALLGVSLTRNPGALPRTPTPDERKAKIGRKPMGFVSLPLRDRDTSRSDRKGYGRSQLSQKSQPS